MSKKWEYNHYKNDFLSQNELNEYGSEGWELIAAIPQGNNEMFFIFKRELKDE